MVGPPSHMEPDLDRRDQLALDRTMLANERTLLAYLRTGLALLGGGAGVLEFVDAAVAPVVGWLFIAAGVLTFPLGFWRYLSVRRRLGAPPPQRR
jgi:putative membrane protein